MKRFAFTKKKSFIVIAACVFLLLLIVEYKQVRQMREVQNEISDLNKQADYYNSQNQQLSMSLSTYDSSFTKEKIAREQLNLKKDGEQVYSYAPNSQASDSSNSNSAALNSTSLDQSGSPVQDQAQKQSNPKKWWNYFFNSQS